MKYLYIIFFGFLIIGCGNEKTSKKPLYVDNFKIELKDTLIVGENYGKIIDYKPTKSDFRCLVSIIIENEYENGKVIRDTFSDGTLNPWFGVYAAQKGELTIRGKLMEEILNDKVNDSILRIERTFFHFSRTVLVVADSLKN